MAENAHPTPSPSDILDRAILFATEAHRGAFRKGTGIPYILHPLDSPGFSGDGRGAVGAVQYEGSGSDRLVLPVDW